MDVIVEKCGCINHNHGYNSSACVKNRYLVYDYKKMRNVNVLICKNYIKDCIVERLERDKIIYNKRLVIEGSNKWIARASTVSSVISNIICDQLMLTKHSFFLNTSRGPQKASPNFSINICDRPNVFVDTNIFEFIDILVNTKKTEGFSFSYTEEYCIDRFILKLKEVCNYYMSYAKYKKTHKFCDKILKKIEKNRKYFFRRDEYRNELVDLFNTILELKINIK